MIKPESPEFLPGFPRFLLTLGAEGDVHPPGKPVFEIPL